MMQGSNNATKGREATQRNIKQERRKIKANKATTRRQQRDEDHQGCLIIALLDASINFFVKIIKHHEPYHHHNTSDYFSDSHIFSF
jgi:hypothetical protein